MAEGTGEKKIRAGKIISALKKEYKNAWCTLNYSNSFELLVSTILSAQCTDARVNMVTPALFERYGDARAMSMAPISSLEKLVHSTGFYKNKARNIKNASKMIVKDFGGKVPNRMEEMLSLPGVARKTANILLFHAFGKNEGIAVDTHCLRISYRLGFASTPNRQEKTENELMQIIPKSDWGMYTNWMVYHGRKYCVARNPKCEICPVRKYCLRVGIGKKLPKKAV